MNKNNENLMHEAESIDYTAVIARLSGQTLSAKQKAMCDRYDRLYDKLHQVMKEAI